MKQLTRIKLLSILFLCTGLVALFVVLKNTSFGGGSDTTKKIAIDSSSLSKISLTYKKETTILTKGQLKWQVNNTYNARPNLIQLMIVGLSKVEIKRPVAEENKKKITAYLKRNGIQVEAKGDEWSRKFLISSNENDANSSYYLEEGSEEPYIVYVPSFSGDMANLLKMTEIDWRSKELFISSPMSLQKIAVSYPAFKTSNVAITWNAKTFNVMGVTKVDSTKVITYLSQFEHVTIDNYVYLDSASIITSLRKNAPQAIIEVSDLNPAGNHKLSIYSESKDPKGIYAIVEPENQLVTMKPETLFRILVRKEFFEKK